MKFYKINRFLLAVLVVILITASCIKEDEKLSYFAISKQFKEYTVFEPGSYWVYRLAGTNMKDTIRVDSSINYLGVNGLDEENNVEFKYDAIELFVHFPNTMSIKKWEVAASNITSVEGTMTDLMRIYYYDQYHTIFQPVHPFGEVIHIGSVSGDYENVSFMDSYNVNGITFNDVYHTRVFDPIDPELPETYDYYIAKHFGIIRQEKRSASDTTVWNLVAWELMQ